MSANVESMFYAGREKPWHGLGTQVEEAPTSADALRLAGLDWTVQRKPIQVCGGRKVDNFFANVRSSDGAVLGVVSDRYQVVQNAEAFAFTDALIGERVRFTMRRREALWVAGRFGCWQNCPIRRSSAIRPSHICASPIPTTVAALSAYV